MAKQRKILYKVGFAQQPADPTTGIKGTYYFNPDSIKQKESAQSWADVIWQFEPPDPNYWPQGYWTTIHQNTPLMALPQPAIRDNKPMKNLVLLNIEQRLEGGRAYKVKNPAENSIFDIREDQMIEAILKYGIQPGGLIGGEWVWAMNHTQIKCYLVDSKEYQDMLKSNNLPNHPVI